MTSRGVWRWNSAAVAKLDARRVAAFLADPGDCRVVLLIGDDAGLARERADALAKLVSGGDELAVVEIARDALKDPGMLAAEAATRPLLGGRYAVRVREATDAFTPAAKLACEGPGPGLVILEGGEMNARAKLRAAMEAAPQAAVIH